MRDINLLVIHCADTPNGSRKFGPRDIDAWHAARGFRRYEAALSSYNPSYPYIGYHDVIDMDGKIHPGRGENEPGAHAVEHNANSLGVCLLGTDKYTAEQWEALKWYVEDVQKRYGGIQIIGHSSVNHHKTCPGFSVQKWLDGGMLPLEGHVL